MQIPIACSLYYTAVVIRRPEIWGPNFHIPFLKYKHCFHENIINNGTNHKNYDATMCQSYSPYFDSIGKKIHTLPRFGLVTIQIARHIYVPLGFGVVLFAKVCIFLPMQFWKAVDFTLALWYPNFKLQYLMNYSSDFNNFCRFQLLAVCTTLL